MQLESDHYGTLNNTDQIFLNAIHSIWLCGPKVDTNPTFSNVTQVWSHSSDVNVTDTHHNPASWYTGARGKTTMADDNED